MVVLYTKIIFVKLHKIIIYQSSSNMKSTPKKERKIIPVSVDTKKFRWKMSNLLVRILHNIRIRRKTIGIC